MSCYTESTFPSAQVGSSDETPEPDSKSIFVCVSHPNATGSEIENVLPRSAPGEVTEIVPPLPAFNQQLAQIEPESHSSNE